MALSINYRSILASAVASNLSVDQIRTKFRPGGTDNMIQAMNEIVKELNRVNDPMAIAVANTAKALIAAPKVVHKQTAPVQNAQVPWWQSGQAVQAAPVQTVQAAPDFDQVPAKDDFWGQFAAKNPNAVVDMLQRMLERPQVPVQAPVQAPRKIVDLDDTASLNAPQVRKEVAPKEIVEVVPKFETEKGLFRVVRVTDENGVNFQLQSLFQGFWKPYMTTRWYKMNLEKFNTFNKAAKAFADKKTKTQFTITLNGKLVNFFWVPDEKNPAVVFAKKGEDKNGNVKMVPGNNYISFKQMGYFQGVMEEFNAIECCKNSVQ